MTVFRHGPRPTLGLIGSIGAGKSTVADLLAARGAIVINADQLGHAALQEGTVRDQLVARWGATILDAKGHVDRRAVSRIVFQDRAEKAALEAVVYPIIRGEINRTIRDAQTHEATTMVVVDAPLLLEAGWADLVDRLLVIDAPRELRLARVMARNGWSDAELTVREASQMTLAEKCQQADAVLVNDGTTDDLNTKLTRFVDRWRWTAGPSME